MGATQSTAADHSTCPVVFGKYMRASGCFYRAADTTYLVTARHNAIPTNSSNLKTGAASVNFQTQDFLPTIDVYLETANGFNVERYDIRDLNGVKQTPEIDLLAVPVTVNPEAYGYNVWDASSIVSPAEANTTLDAIGFNGESFPHPDKEYSTQEYASEIDSPVRIGIENDLRGADYISTYELVAPGIHEGVTADTVDYNGFSGAPVIGDNLVGIHAVECEPPQHAINQVGGEEFMMTVYWRASILPKLLF